MPVPWATSSWRLACYPAKKTHSQGKSQKKENAEKSACSAQPPADHNQRGFSSGHFSPERILTSGYFSLHSKLTPLPGKPAAPVFQEALDNMGPSHRHFSAVAPKPRSRDMSCSAATSTQKLHPCHHGRQYPCCFSMSSLPHAKDPPVIGSICLAYPREAAVDLCLVFTRRLTISHGQQFLAELEELIVQFFLLTPWLASLTTSLMAHGSWLTAHAHQEHWTCREPSHTNHFRRTAARTFCDHQPLSWPSCTPYCAPFDHLGMERGCWCGI